MHAIPRLSSISSCPPSRLVARNLSIPHIAAAAITIPVTKIIFIIIYYFYLILVLSSYFYFKP